MSNDIRFKNPVRDDLQQIDDNSWLFGRKVVISRQPSPSTGPSWSDGKGSFFVLSEAPDPLPPTRPLPPTSEFEKVYDAGDATAVWRVGDAYCKAKTIDPHTTREHVTLDYLDKKRPLSFAIPDTVYYHAEGIDGRYYIILSKVPGQTLNETWFQMDETMKQHCVSRITDICKELAAWQGDCMSGVDGQHLSERYLSGKEQNPRNLSPANLQKHCEEIGMDCSAFVFYHCDLGAGNVLVDVADGSISIIDWEIAGFVPKVWIRTKFRVSSGLDLPSADFDTRTEWRRRVQRHMEKEGFPDIVEPFMKWFQGRRESYFSILLGIPCHKATK